MVGHVLCYLLNQPLIIVSLFKVEVRFVMCFFFLTGSPKIKQQIHSLSSSS